MRGIVWIQKGSRELTGAGRCLVGRGTITPNSFYLVYNETRLQPVVYKGT